MKLISSTHARAQRHALAKAEADRDWYRGMLSDLAVSIATGPQHVYLDRHTVAVLGVGVAYGTEDGGAKLPIPRSQHLRRAYRAAANALGLSIKDL